jgi:hypothetical protein
MKTRNGFVSNSSSSSFVVFGADISDREDLVKKFKDPEGYRRGSCLNEDLFPQPTECSYYDGEGTILGWGLGGGDTSCGDFGVSEVSIDELVEYAKAFEAATGLKPKLMGGCYPC